MSKTDYISMVNQMNNTQSPVFDPILANIFESILPVLDLHLASELLLAVNFGIVRFDNAKEIMDFLRPRFPKLLIRIDRKIANIDEKVFALRSELRTIKVLSE